MSFGDGICPIELPIGYRFAPTDLELATFYLQKKVSSRPVVGDDIKEIDAHEFYSHSPEAIGIYRSQDHDLTTEQEGEEVPMIGKDRIEMNEEFHKQEENQKIRIVGDGIGYWRSSGKKEVIYDAMGRAYAFKIHFVYFSGSPNRGKQTHWRLEEYHLITSDRSCDDGGRGGGETRNSKIDDWVLGRITRGRNYASFF
ncbi:hypothetical protein CDL12_23328 [Handroanthus impetiginosus]|uniref:NAC domain-containing protein n=1 Tax=Handroanthus impetiginosus TaxID=429701 RepID=A0A2G9GFS0_9LAMI|nr:hypothetical protein CDL12_23328 [Handroanthus impetiginosus]